MTEEIVELKTKFLAYIRKIEAVSEALELVYWDLRTKAPAKGMEQRAEVVSVLSSEIFAMKTSEKMAAFIAELAPVKEKLDEVARKTLEEAQKEYEWNKKIPADEYAVYTKLVAQAETVWSSAREAKDFHLLEPYLTKIIEMKRRFVEYWGYKDNKYDTLLEQYEPGMTVALLDDVFGKLRAGITALREKIKESTKKPDPAILNIKIPKVQQQTFSRSILKKMGFDFEAGRIDDTIHPFAIGLNPGDVRITSRYDENNFKMAVFGIIHEGGHAIYEQNFAPKLIGTNLATGASMGIHESQSLFYEIIIGSSLAFWESNYPAFQQIAAPNLDHISLESFYRAVNLTESSLIRIEADILTYPLHIMIRYELEKALLNDELEVKDLPQVWADKYEAYLGIRPNNDTEGVLQDIHWAGGDFGYFPSYALGLMYAAQMFHQMQQDIPNVEKIIASDDYSPIKNWLTEHVHQYGKLKEPLQILQDATGETLEPKYLLALLKKRYQFVYQLDELEK